MKDKIIEILKANFIDEANDDIYMKQVIEQSADLILKQLPSDDPEYESIINEIADAKGYLNRAEVALANILDRHDNQSI